jgi:putative restriction endonuclease
MAESGRRWNREELIVAFNFYCRTPFGRLSSTNPDIVCLAKILKRTPSAVAMKLVNFASLDPQHKERGVKGLPNVSKADRTIWEEFHSDWEGLAYESQVVLDGLRPPKRSHIQLPSDVAAREGETERIAETRIRLVQSFFRATILASYNCVCSVCQLNLEEMLMASHIIPWAVDSQRRADPTNGILLCALHDRAFDRGLFTIDDSFQLRVATRVRKATTSKIQLLALVAIEGSRIVLPERFLPDRDALAFHRENIFENR